VHYLVQLDFLLCRVGPRSVDRRIREKSIGLKSKGVQTQLISASELQQARLYEALMKPKEAKSDFSRILYLVPIASRGLTVQIVRPDQLGTYIQDQDSTFRFLQVTQSDVAVSDYQTLFVKHSLSKTRLSEAFADLTHYCRQTTSMRRLYGPTFSPSTMASCQERVRNVILTKRESEVAQKAAGPVQESKPYLVHLVPNCARTCASSRSSFSRSPSVSASKRSARHHETFSVEISLFLNLTILFPDGKKTAPKHQETVFSAELFSFNLIVLLQIERECTGRAHVRSTATSP
jgi:hypothetical protein